jgi:hypothetical protein
MNQDDLFLKIKFSGLVPISMLNMVVCQLSATEQDFTKEIARLKRNWAALKHEIDLQFPGKNYALNAYIFDCGQKCVWGFDGMFEAIGISSKYAIDKQLEGKRLLAARLNTDYPEDCEAFRLAD